jgi:hypothetical protein
MFHDFFLILTSTALSCILASIWYKKKYKKIKYSQSSIHKIIIPFLEEIFYSTYKKPSQVDNHTEKNSVKVIFSEDKAYWVSNNVFYCANAIKNNVDIDSAKPINTENLNEQDINKLLFILDTLKNGTENDSGGSGNQRF